MKEVKLVEINSGLNGECIYFDDVERIVNDPERQRKISEFYSEKSKQHKNKILTRGFVCIAASVAIGSLGVIGWINPFLSCWACGFFVLKAAFGFGRFFGVDY